MINPFKPRQVVFIEALIKCIKAKQAYENRRYFQVDGCIIGDGSQDFTRTYSSFALDINGSSAQLIDIPGIEGDEEKFTEIIKSALKKAHLVCYVARESKGIEENTLKKIKEYMQKNVTEMVGIHNIPLQPKLEYDGDDYVGDITREIELKNRKNRNIEEQLQRAIPDGMYRDTVGISALPGLCALAIHNGWTTFASPEKNHGNPAVAKSLGRLRDQQRTFLSRTSDVELLKASRLNKLRNVIIESCSDAPRRIKKASLIRLSRLLQDDYLADISTQKKSIGEFRNSIRNRTDRFVSKLGSARDQMKRNMRHSVKNAVYDFFRKDITKVVRRMQRGLTGERTAASAELSSDEQRVQMTLTNLRKRGGFLSRELSYAIEIAQKNYDEFRDYMQVRMMKSVRYMEQGNHIVMVMAAAAPLLGLLGTVTGMVSTFEVITLYGNQNPVLMADVISEALISTQSGLLIAFPLTLLKQRLDERIEILKQEMELGATVIDNYFATRADDSCINETYAGESRILRHCEP